MAGGGSGLLLRGAATILAVIFAGLLASACRKDAQRPVFEKAPVVLISIDTLRSDRLPAYGYDKVETPHLDRFEKDSWFFEKAYSPCPMTLPSHVTMLTGTLPPEHGVRNNIGFVFDGKAHQNLPLLLREKGYATGAAVSSYVLRHETGIGPLFDYYEDSIGISPGVEAVHYRRAGDQTAALATSWITQQGGKPFFLFFHIYEPHLPFNPPEPFRTKYGVSYDAEVATSDAIVGSLLEDLRKTGVYDRAIIIVTSDHGEGLGDHGEEQHSVLLYREAIQVPLFIKLPKNFGAGKRVTVPAQLSDLFPTVFSALGLPVPKGVSGKSLLADAGGAGTEGRIIYGETLFPRLQLGWSELHSVLDGRFHYIHGPRPELYDLVADPAELNDLAKKDEENARRLARELLKFPKGNEKPQSVDQETAKRLASLGYFGTLRDRSSDGPLPNPVDSLPSMRRMQEAWRLSAEGKVREAVEVLRKSVKENPGMIDAWVRLGELLVEAGQDEEAVEAYRQAAARSVVFVPDRAISHGVIELRRQKFDEAEKLAKAAVAELPVPAHELLARIALAKGDLAVAETEARQAAGSRSPQPSSVLLVAEVKLKAGKPQEALQEIEKARALAKDLRLSSVYNLDFLRGDALGRLDRMEEAEAAFSAEIAAFPKNSQAYSTLAIIQFIRGNRTGVERTLEEMVRANPSPRSYLLAASTLDSLGEKSRAAEWRRRAAAR
jgi:arylsulfatase A-like enzyme/Flp pilus assembly protein TadD